MMKKKRPLARCDQIINYFYEPMKKTVDIVKDKVMSFYKKRTKIIAKKYVEKKCRKQLEDKIIRHTKVRINRDIRKIIELEEKKYQKKL